MKQKLKCKNCGHQWETKSKLRFVSCPSCLRKTKVDGGNKNGKNQ